MLSFGVHDFNLVKWTALKVGELGTQETQECLLPNDRQAVCVFYPVLAESSFSLGKQNP